VSIREEFEEAFSENCSVSSDMGSHDIALWAAKWMAERCASHLETSKGLNHYKHHRRVISEAVFEICHLAKQLEERG
jgi:hypothetical protein